MNNTLTPPQPKNQQSHAKQQPSEKRAQVPPPIMVEKVNSYEDLYSMITNKINKNQFQVKLLSENSAKINAADSESYRIIVDVLQKANHTLNSYENKQSRPIRVMIKELHHTCKPQSVIQNLREQGFNAVEAINKLSFKKKTPLNMFMVTFENKEDIDKIYKISHILGCRVDVQAIKGSNLIPQCKRCQSFGHTRTYCSRQSRCVKCAGKHATSECGKTKDMEAKCVNCGGNHPASYRGCIVAKELQMIKNKKMKTKQQLSDKEPLTQVTSQQILNQQAIVPSKAEGKMTYAKAVASGTSHENPSSETSLINSVQLILQKMFSLEGSIASINSKVNHLESRINPSARRHQQ